MSDKLSNREYWDAVHSACPVSPSPLKRAVSGMKQRLGRWLGDQFVEAARDYSSYLLWRVILPKYLVCEPGMTVLEVGSAPGFNLLMFRDTFGYSPYGIEYSPSGAETNRRVFEIHGLDPDHVIQGDFLSDEVRRPWRGRFDVVTSFGFIEHFSDVGAIIDKHLELLKPGGRLVIGIPNIAGVNDRLTRFFHREVLDIHNLTIMSKSSFRSLFERPDLGILFCDYYGTFTLNLFNTRPNSWKRRILSLARRVQKLLNMVFYFCFRARGCESAGFSPYLLLVGRKR